jgi:type III secretion system low calcium response chaperone LcrH/SycD
MNLKDDTEALLRLFGQGGTLGGLYGLSSQELEALYAFGLGYYRQARYGDALKVFAQLVSLKHGETKYLNALAATHQMLGHHPQAIHHWGVSQLLDATDPLPTFHTANSLLAMGEVGDALDALALVITQCQRDGDKPALLARAEALQALVKAKAASAAATA